MAEEETTACYRIHPPTMEDRVKVAAEEGNVDALYEVIREKPELLKEIDEMEFAETPLHIAAASGHTEFAMELMHLKPSLGKKLNQDGLSPMHIALKEGHTETVLSLLEINEDLVRVRGKNGYTPLHYLFIHGKQGNNLQVLTQFLKKCPQCIHDVTNRNQTALHLAAMNNDYPAFEILLYWLWGSENSIKNIKRILNAKNRNGDNVLHIAASNNQPKILKLAVKYWVINLEAPNSKNLTALEIVESQNGDNKKECANILRCAKRWRSIYSHVMLLVQVTSHLADKVRSMSGDSSNALLVVATLILTATYQSALSPPGGVYQTNAEQDNTTSTMITFLVHTNSSNATRNHHLFEKLPLTAGSSVLGTKDFLWFFIPNIAAFCLSFVVTCFILISILPCFFSTTLVASLSTLLFCLLVSAVRIISPNSECLHIMVQYVYLLFYVLGFVIFVIAVALLIKEIGRKIFYKQYIRTNKRNLSPEC